MVLFSLMLPSALVQPAFPADFVGDWRGTMVWSRPGAKPQSVAMRLKIAKSASGSEYTYLLAYGDAGKDERPYLLKPVDAAKGLWQIDERNGIVLDAAWVGESLVSVFSVSGNTIQTRLSREGETLVSLMTTYTGGKRTGGKQGAPEVTTHQVLSVQRAILRRTKE